MWTGVITVVDEPNVLYHEEEEMQACERKCADTTGTVLVTWAGQFQC